MGAALKLRKQRSTVSILSILAAVASIASSLIGHSYWGLCIAVGAIVLGSIGFGIAASIRITEGFLSVAAIVLSVIGLVLAILVTDGALDF